MNAPRLCTIEEGFETTQMRSRVGIQRIEGPDSDPALGEKPRFAEDLQVVRDRGLAELEMVDDVADTGRPLLGGYQAQDLETGGIAQGARRPTCWRPRWSGAAVTSLRRT